MIYRLGLFGEIIRDKDSALIPKDPENIDYQDFLKWISAGNTPAPYVPKPLTLEQQYDLEVKNYDKLKALMNMTPAQVQAWVKVNVTTLAQAQDAIATLAIAISRLARRI